MCLEFVPLVFEVGDGGVLGSETVPQLVEVDLELGLLLLQGLFDLGQFFLDSHGLLLRSIEFHLGLDGLGHFHALVQRRHFLGRFDTQRIVQLDHLKMEG